MFHEIPRIFFLLNKYTEYPRVMYEQIKHNNVKLTLLIYKNHGDDTYISHQINPKTQVQTLCLSHIILYSPKKHSTYSILLIVRRKKKQQKKSSISSSIFLYH